MTFQETINNAQNINELFELLTSYEASENNGLKLDEVISLEDLPTFGSMDQDAFTEKYTDTTYPVWSWDDEKAIVGEGEFELVSLTELED